MKKTVIIGILLLACLLVSCDGGTESGETSPIASQGTQGESYVTDCEANGTSDTASEENDAELPIIWE